MALGGGTFIYQNKILPGAYINVKGGRDAAVTAGSFGIAALVLPMSWGAENAVIRLGAREAAVFVQKIGALIGDSAKTAILECAANASELILFRPGTGTKAANTYAESQFAGAGGNKLAVSIEATADSKYIVATYADNVKVDEQTVSAASELQANEFVSFKAGITLAETAKTSLTGGADATLTITDYDTALNALAGVRFRALGLVSAAGGAEPGALLKQYVKAQREDTGKHIVGVTADYDADYEGVIDCKKTALIPWVTGLEAGLRPGEDGTNRAYNGSLDPFSVYGSIWPSQQDYEDAVTAGKFVLHDVDGTYRVLMDINTMTTDTADKGAMFRRNRVVRIADDLADRVSALFVRTYMGVARNNDAERGALRADVGRILGDMTANGSLDGYDEDALTVERGIDAGSVVIGCAVTVSGVMEKLYMTVTIE